MKLPNHQKAYISEDKLKNYLLKDTHPIGRSKSKFFNHFGFNDSNIKLLKKRLLEMVHKNDVIEELSSPYGVKYIIDGEMRTPTNHHIKI